MALEFSRMGLGLEEARKKEAEQRDITSDVHETRLMSRGMRRSYRDAMRSGNSMAAANILNMAKEGGIPMAPGIRGAGSLRREMSGKYQDERAAWERTRTAAKQGPANEWDEDGNGIPNSIQRDPATNPLAPTPVAAGPLASKMTFAQQEQAKRNTYNAQNSVGSTSPLEQFSSNMSASKLIASGDPMAQKRAVEQGLKLGLSFDDIESIGGFDARSARTFTDDPFKNSLANPASPARPSNPLFDAAMARVSAAGGAARDGDIAGIERVGNLQAEMEAARQKTDARYSGAPLTGIADAERTMRQSGVAQAFRARGLAIQASQRVVGGQGGPALGLQASPGDGSWAAAIRDQIGTVADIRRGEIGSNVDLAARAANAAESGGRSTLSAMGKILGSIRSSGPKAASLIASGALSEKLEGAADDIYNKQASDVEGLHDKTYGPLMKRLGLNRKKIKKILR